MLVIFPYETARCRIVDGFGPVAPEIQRRVYRPSPAPNCALFYRLPGFTETRILHIDHKSTAAVRLKAPFVDLMREQGVGIHEGRAELYGDVQERHAAMERVLDQPKFVRINGEFKAAGRRRRGRPCYQLLAVRSIRAVSESRLQSSIWLPS